MARKPTPREWTLLGVVAALGLVALWIQDPRNIGLGGGPAGEVAEAPDLGQAPVIHLVRLEPIDETYDPRGRNLFEYYTPPPPPRPTPPSPRAPKVRPITEPRPTPPPQQTVRQPPKETRPQPPRISFSYLGYLGPKDAKIAVFEEGEEIILARPGETVQDQFRVVEFQYEKIVMGYVDAKFADQTTELKQRKRK